MTLACYVRVSTASQNEAGQKREIKRWLKGNGLGEGGRQDAAHVACDAETVRWFIDKESGDNLSRPAFEALQSAIFNGEIDTVVVWKLDRLSRKLRDGLNVLCDWCDRGVRLVSVTQQIDLSGVVGKMIAAVLLGVAEMEQETRRERQRAGIEAAKARGVYWGRKPGTTKAKPRRARRLRDKGATHDEIARALGVSRRTVIRYLKVA